MLVDRAPQVPQPAVDPDEHLVEVPLVAGARAPPAQLVGVGPPELRTPGPDRLLTHRDTAYEHQLLDLTQAEREPEVQPHAVVDDLDRVAVAPGRRRCGGHPTNPPRSPTLTNVTVPGPSHPITARSSGALYRPVPAPPVATNYGSWWPVSTSLSSGSSAAQVHIGGVGELPRVNGIGPHLIPLGGVGTIQVAGWTYWSTWTGGLVLLGLTGLNATAPITARTSSNLVTFCRWIGPYCV